MGIFRIMKRVVEIWQASYYKKSEGGMHTVFIIIWGNA
jgi:hypothetical protein